MTVPILNILLRRINNLSDRSDRNGVLKAALSTVRVEGLRKKLQLVAVKYTPQYFKGEMEKRAFTKGFHYVAQNAASRQKL